LAKDEGFKVIAKQSRDFFNNASGKSEFYQDLYVNDKDVLIVNLDSFLASTVEPFCAPSVVSILYKQAVPTVLFIAQAIPTTFES